MKLGPITYCTLAIIGLIFLGCEKSETITESRNKTLIISSFPEVGQPINDLKIQKFNDSGQYTIPVNDADVSIIWKNNYFGMDATAENNGTYAINNSSFIVQPNNEYKLEINYKGELITGSSTTPPNFEEFIYDRDILDAIDDGGHTNDTLNIQWRKNSGLIYLINIKSMSDNPTPILFTNVGTKEIEEVKEMLDKPFVGNKISLPAHAFSYYGLHTITITAVKEKHAGFFELNSFGSPYSNIKNGKGYFIGIERQKVIIDVTN